jgi:RHO1 GDP-GTP exchange protein 1/2
MYVQPLINASPPIIAPERIKSFLADVFHNYAELLPHHRRLVSRLHQIQQEEHPLINSITPAVFDLILNVREPFLDYAPNYRIAEYKIQEELRKNPEFKAFHDVCDQISDSLTICPTLLY